MVTDRECELCKMGLEEKIDAGLATSLAAVKSLRREIYTAVAVGTSITGIFISILGLLLYTGVI